MGRRRLALLLAGWQAPVCTDFLESVGNWSKETHFLTMFSPSFNCYCLHPVLIYSELFWRPSAGILVGMATTNKLWIPVNTDEIGWMLVVIIWSHQVPMILLGPSRWTVIPGRHHQHRATWLDEADNTWCFMILEISLKRVSVAITYFIFSAVHVSGVLMAICVLVILWIVWKAKVVRSTTRVSVMLSTHYTWYKAKKNINNYSLKFCQRAKLIKRFPVPLFTSAWNGG